MFRYQRALPLVLWTLVLSFGITGCGADGVTEKIDSGADSITNRNTARQSDWDAGKSAARSNVASSGIDPLLKDIQLAGQTSTGSMGTSASSAYDNQSNKGVGTADAIKMIAFAGITMMVMKGGFDFQNIFPKSSGNIQPSQALAQNNNSGSNGFANAFKFDANPANEATSLQTIAPVALNLVAPKEYKQVSEQFAQAVVQKGRSSGDEKQAQPAQPPTQQQVVAAKPAPAVASGVPECSSAAAPTSALAQGYVQAAISAAEKQNQENKVQNSPAGAPAGANTNVSVGAQGGS